jgi:hypothetical protein
LAVDDGAVPAALGEVAVVIGAEEAAVGDGGGAVVALPFVEVMS